MTSLRTLYHPACQEIRLSAVLQALGDPVRLAVVKQVAGQAEASCNTIDVPLAKSTLSHHFKVLREAGVVNTRIEGTQRFMSLRWADLDLRFPGLLAAVLGAGEPL